MVRITVVLTGRSGCACLAGVEAGVSKAIIRAGGFGDFANKRKVKVTRKNGQDFTVDLKRVIEEGRSEEDLVLQPDDQIYVPQRLINM